jgi:hypothetical protein
MARDFRRALASIVRIGATALVSAAITTVVLTVFTPEPAVTASKPIVIVEGERLYPVSVATNPSITFMTHDAFLEDYAALRNDLMDLRHAIDYDAAHGGVSPSVHEWADGRAPGELGGGRQP